MNAMDERALTETYNRIAESWHRDHGDDDWWIEGTDLFISKLERGSLVLDVGCGGGTKAQYLFNHGLKVIGIDISNKLLAIAQKEVPGVSFRELSMKAVPKMEEEFNGIFAQASLLHAAKAEIPHIIAGFLSRLKVGGILYIAVKEVKANTPEEEIVTESDYGFEYQRFFSYYTMPELITYFHEAGLTVIGDLRNQTGKTVWLQILGRK
jgi:SAM-dependent methyltransferase